MLVLISFIKINIIPRIRVNKILAVCFSRLILTTSALSLYFDRSVDNLTEHKKNLSFLSI